MYDERVRPVASVIDLIKATPTPPMAEPSTTTAFIHWVD